MSEMTDRPKMQQLGELDPNATIWRYLTFQKFVSLIATGALWFSKLQVFEDAFEGTIPEPARRGQEVLNRSMEDWFQDDEVKRQIRRFTEENEENGREMIVASCWFISKHESVKMWGEYAIDDEGVVIKSTIGDLAQSLALSHDQWWIGKVSYIDFTQHDSMDVYQGSQAHLRASLKSKEYTDESELRVATVNWVTLGCLNPDGSPPDEKQRAGFVYSEGRSGIFVKANLPVMIGELRTAPGATDWHRSRVDLLRSTAGIRVPVSSSALSMP
ncbi:MAG TPA: hypothetical protein VGG99_28640 [Acetobacteraceae bacterium]|jgi:hypothetical protein